MVSMVDVCFAARIQLLAPVAEIRKAFVGNLSLMFSAKNKGISQR